MLTWTTVGSGRSFLHGSGWYDRPEILCLEKGKKKWSLGFLFIWNRWSLELPSMNFPLTFVSPPIPLIWVQVYVSLHPSVLTDLIVKTNMWLFDPLLPPTVVQPLIPCLFSFLFLSLICKSYTDIITNDYFRSVGQCLIVIFLKSINLANVYTVFHWHNLQLSLFFAYR